MKNNQLRIRVNSAGEYKTALVLFYEIGGYSRKPKITVEEIAGYDAVVSEDGIKVGCQTISFEKFDELVKAVNKIRS
jgi:hypothetical protein